MENHIESFRAAIAAAGLTPPKHIYTGDKVHRFATNGNPADDAGWYVLHVDGVPAGAFGDFRTGIDERWRADIGRKLTPDEAAALRVRMEAIKRQRMVTAAAEALNAMKLAAQLWQRSAPAPDRHPYLERKGIKTHGLRVLERSLLVPVMDGSTLHSVQFIDTDGAKRFLKGGRVKGCYFVIGDPTDVICVVEGLATGASVHEATGFAVAVAFDAGNLPAAARALRSRFPDARIIICADDDARTAGNPGLTKAREAAAAIGAPCVFPHFGVNRPDRATDFNDLHQHAGLDAVRAGVEHALEVQRVAEAHDEWPEPRPIIAELKPVPVFDADTLLPEVLRRWIMDEAERMPCPPDFIAAAAIVALGSIIGARCAIKPKTRDSWLIVPNVWGGIVGDPAAKKSPAWAAALQPLDGLIAAATKAHAEALAEYETAKVVFDAQQEAIQKSIKSSARGRKQDEMMKHAAELRTHGSQGPKAPVLRRYKTNDSTVEKLGELLCENPTGLLVLRDELVGLLANWDRDGREGDRAFFLEAWNGNQSFDTDRIGRGHISVLNLCVSIFGGIQPDKLTGYLEQAANSLANDGTLQRFQVLVFPESRKWEWRNRVPDQAARAAAVSVFEALAEFAPVSWGASPADDSAKFPYFCFDADAQTVFIEWSTDLHQKRIEHEDEPLIRQHLGKFDKLFPALALVLHLVDCAATGKRGPVGKESALRAAAWCEYLEAHARRCYGLLKDDGLRAAQALAAKLMAGELQDGFTLRRVRRNQWRNLTTNDVIQAGLEWLEDEGWLRSEIIGGSGPGSGRRTTCYKINPAIAASGAGK